MGKELSEKQQLFAKEFLRDRNATQAAIRAGYSPNPKSAKNYGSKLARNPDIKRLIDELGGKAAEEVGMTPADILRQMKDELERCRQLAPALTPYGKPRFKADGEPLLLSADTSGAIRLFELFGKNMGLFADKLEISGTVNVERLEKARQRVINAGLGHLLEKADVRK